MNRIDRKALVDRHSPVVSKMDISSPFSVGNGEFAFTADFTGLQTFYEEYEPGMPLGTMSNWGWHTSLNPDGFAVEKYKPIYYEHHGRQAGYLYAHPITGRTPEVKWLRDNPHRLHLGMLMFRFLSVEGAPASIQYFSDVEQTLDLWRGIIRSRYKLFGYEVAVETCCHPDMDMIAVRVESDLVMSGQAQVLFRFPYGSPDKQGCDWEKPDSHSTEFSMEGDSCVNIVRVLDNDGYYVKVKWSGNGEFFKEAAHRYVLRPFPDGKVLEFLCCFSQAPIGGELPSYCSTREWCEKYWEKFWSSGGAVELFESEDLRALELERRIVLSQYLTAIQSGGSLPPQESGLVHNSWSGKFHLEMHWWHSTHFVLWGRPDMLEKSLSWYLTIMDKARETAANQGYTGVRWPKCTGPEGVNAPCFIEPFLIWQQPHPIYFADILYRATKDRRILERYMGMVFETAEFMASFAIWEEEGKRYVLGPPLVPAQEVHHHETTYNPAFELSYWGYGLKIAQKWREYFALGRDEKWDHVLNHLSSLPAANGVYVAAETVPDTFEKPEYVRDHPTMLAPLGMLPGWGVDREMMKRTLHKVMEVWNWDSTWGWDYPMMAMTAARLGEYGKAVNLLLMDTPKNHYLTNGHCFQRAGLPVYLPANGGLLSATAMMAAGWENGPDINAPGFPHDGKWTVRCEGMMKMP